MFLPSLPALVSSLLLSRRGRTMIGRHMGKIVLAGVAWQFFKNRPGADDGPAVKAEPSSRRRSRKRSR